MRLPWAAFAFDKAFQKTQQHYRAGELFLQNINKHLGPFVYSRTRNLFKIECKKQEETIYCVTTQFGLRDKTL